MAEGGVDGAHCGPDDRQMRAVRDVGHKSSARFGFFLRQGVMLF